MSDSDNDSDDNSDMSSHSEKEEVEIEVFEEDSQAVEMAVEEERQLKALMDKRRSEAGVSDSMVTSAMALMDAVALEKFNDHGKPWKEPPAVAYSTEYWKEWRQRVSVDKANAESEEEVARNERMAMAEKKRNRPKIRAPLPVKVDRNGVKGNRIANFSQKFYDAKADPTIPPKKRERMIRKEKGKAVNEVKAMMDAFGVDSSSYADLERQNTLRGVSSKSFGKSVGFSTGTRDDWSKVITVGKKPGKVGGAGTAPPTQYDVGQAMRLVQRKGPTGLVVGRPNETFDDMKKTPGPIYEPKLDSLSTKIHSRTIEFSSNPRFKEVVDKPGGEEPGPSSYNIPSPSKKTIVLPFNGLKEFSYGEKEEAPNLRAMRNFGHGCNLQEHILYGQCLDGKCSDRGFWEKRNVRKIGHWRKKEKKLKVKGEESKDAEKTALHFAAIYRDFDLVHKLCKDGLNVDAVDEEMKTVLHIACEKGLTRITERLLNNKDHPLIAKVGYVSKRINPLIDEQDKDGHTPLHLASIGAHRKCCELLIDAGANPDILNKEGMTALDVAGTQALFQALEYYSEMSMERARTESIKMQTKRQGRRQDEYEREKERQKYREAQQREKVMAREMDDIAERGKTMLLDERSFVESNSGA